jgi:hypothetical protein
MDFELAENLTVKLEGRYDRITDGSNQSSRLAVNPLSDEDVFLNGSTGQAGESDQFTTGVEVIYAF